MKPLTLVIAAAALLPAGLASAQSYAITWSSVDGGGAMFTTGGVYTLGSSTGQCDAGPPMTSGSQAVTGGFWVAATIPVTPPCPADFNHSGAVSVQDIFDFLSAYFANDPSADFNGSGAVSVQDIFDFLAAYFVGC